ncbi:PQQ-binding-like beta-propeller repeat protein [Planctomycetes bacterium K23_9]|uniref:Outer membrane biogenesis protein BamB n=1 Tax=Stieleria marina TaxID=1930275 RepID=A0A517P0D6_9BACT|nr:outer membrane biogenesis protein BamB [Planctomycetes bacterium K23_9]
MNPRSFIAQTLIVVPLFLLVELLACQAVAQEWTRFRGQAGSGIGGENIPSVWSDSENLAWKTKLPGKGSSSPVVWGDKVFLTAFSGYGLSAEEPGDRADLKLHVICLSLADGKILWDRQVDPSAEEQNASKRVVDHGYASPTACVDSENVYAFFGPSGLVAFSHEGQQLWRRSVGTKTAGFGAAASPVLWDDLVIINASIEDGAVYGIEKSTGVVRWRTGEITKAWTTPTLVTLSAGNTELVVNQKEAILGLDPQTGSRLWSCDAIEDYVVPCVVADGETLYCSGGRSNKTFVVKAGGRGDVSESHQVWDASLGANVTSPVLLDGHLYWSHDKSIALCLRASDGEMMFRERMPTRSRVYASVVSDGEKLFLTTRDAGVLVLAASPEYKQIAVNKLGADGEMFNATPALVGPSLLIRSDQNLYCIRQD